MGGELGLGERAEQEAFVSLIRTKIAPAEVHVYLCGVYSNVYLHLSASVYIMWSILHNVSYRM